MAMNFGSPLMMEVLNKKHQIMGQPIIFFSQKKNDNISMLENKLNNHIFWQLLLLLRVLLSYKHNEGLIK